MNLNILHESKLEIIKNNKEFLELGSNLSKYVVGPEGNISWRCNKDTFLIKASGCELSNMDSDSIVVCDIDGNSLTKNKRPSMEVGFHSWLYKNTDCKVIAHTHPTNVMKILCSGLTNLFATTRLFPDQVVFNGSNSCVVPYVTPGQELVAEISSVINKHDTAPKLFLLKNHGIICCAKDFREAVVMTQICDKAAEIFLGIQGINPSYLTSEQIYKIENHEAEVYRRGL